MTTLTLDWNVVKCLGMKKGRTAFAIRPWWKGFKWKELAYSRTIQTFTVPVTPPGSFTGTS